MITSEEIFKLRKHLQSLEFPIDITERRILQNAMLKIEMCSVIDNHLERNIRKIMKKYNA